MHSESTGILLLSNDTRDERDIKLITWSCLLLLLAVVVCFQVSLLIEFCTSVMVVDFDLSQAIRDFARPPDASSLVSRKDIEQRKSKGMCIVCGLAPTHEKIRFSFGARWKPKNQKEQQEPQNPPLVPFMAVTRRLSLRPRSIPHPPLCEETAIVTTCCGLSVSDYHPSMTAILPFIRGEVGETATKRV
jgi:hypothetical protein